MSENVKINPEDLQNKSVVELEEIKDNLQEEIKDNLQEELENEKELTDEEKKEIFIEELKKSKLTYKTKKNFDAAYKEKRKKKNRATKKSRKANR